MFIIADVINNNGDLGQFFRYRNYGSRHRFAMRYFVFWIDFKPGRFCHPGFCRRRDGIFARYQMMRQNAGNHNKKYQNAKPGNGELQRRRLQEEIDDLGPVRMTEIADAQQAITGIIQEMEAKGEIIISGRRGEEIID